MKAIALSTALLLAGCAGHKAMVIDRPGAEPPCGVRICEPWGGGRVVPERDCKCAGNATLEDILRGRNPY